MTEREASDTRALLLQSGRKIFAEKGYEGATVKDVADTAGVNISLVSYHFGGKEGLYRTCLEDFGSRPLEIAERLLRSPQSPEDFSLRLRLFAEELTALHLAEPEVIRILQRDIDLANPVIVDVFRRVFIRILHAFLSFVSDSQKAGFLRGDVDPHVASVLAMGALLHVLKSEQLCSAVGLPTIADRAYRESLIEHWVELVTRGFLVSQKISDESKHGPDRTAKKLVPKTQAKKKQRRS